MSIMPLLMAADMALRDELSTLFGSMMTLVIVGFVIMAVGMVVLLVLFVIIIRRNLAMQKIVTDRIKQQTNPAGPVVPPPPPFS